MTPLEDANDAMTNSGTPRGGLSAVVRCRLEEWQLEDLDVLEAHLRGEGDRTATRSRLIRDAITAYLVNAAKDLPPDKAERMHAHGK